jgi:hypothetical protein
MIRIQRASALVIAVLVAGAGAGPAFAQKSGGVLKIHHRDSPASLSIHEEAIPVLGGLHHQYVRV